MLRKSRPHSSRTSSPVANLAREMGREQETGLFHGRRIAQTVIRRNWHLLNYPQLLTLLGWEEGELAECLIEHDFFWVKLGRLKPKCAPLTYREPTAQERKHAAWMGAVVRAERGRVPDDDRA